MNDCVDSNLALSLARERILASGFAGRLCSAVVYASSSDQSTVDLHLERLEGPHAFAWTLFHRDSLVNYCVDIDGVLCLDPDTSDNDDGPRYLRFLETATPIARPSHRIGHLVTSRLEKYRAPTTLWLQRHGIAFDQLHMLDGATAEERRRLGLHAQFKARVYRSLQAATLFIESEPVQAARIAQLSGKPVLDYTSQRLAVAEVNKRGLRQTGGVSSRVLDKVRRVFVS